MRPIRLILLIVASALAGAVVMFAVLHKPEAADEDDAPKSAAAPSRISVIEGEPTIQLDAATQQKIGLTVTPATTSTQQDELQILGSVVDVSDLAGMQSQVAAARAQAAQASAKLSFDRAELARMKALNADNRNVSDRAVQEAAANVAADEAAIATADAAQTGARAQAVQRFGPAVAAHIDNLLTMREVLIEFALPPGLTPPQTLQAGGVTARYLSPSPRVDPRVQRATFLYVAPAGGGLSAGMSVTARYAAARSVSGVAIPRDALVSFQGRSWVYVQRDATHFSRREVSGAFATNIAPATPLVTTGAQQLLSEEMRAQLHED